MLKQKVRSCVMTSVCQLHKGPVVGGMYGGSCPGKAACNRTNTLFGTELHSMETASHNKRYCWHPGAPRPVVSQQHARCHS